MFRVFQYVCIVASVAALTISGLPAQANPQQTPVFPVQQGAYHYSDTWQAARSQGRKHNGTDIMAKQMTPIYAMVSGTINKAKNEDIHVGTPSSSYYLLLDGDDGRSYFYVHINNDTPGRPNGCDKIGGMENAFSPKLVEYAAKHGTIAGMRVNRGDHIAYVGSSGNASCNGPHLHLEIWPRHGWSAQHYAYNPYGILKNIEAGMANPWPAQDPEYTNNYHPGTPEPGKPTAPAKPPVAPPAKPPVAPPAKPPVAPPTKPAPPPAKPPVTPFDDANRRISSTNRVLTAVEMSKQTFLRADTAVVVPAGSYREALIGAPLAALDRGPVLLADHGVPDAVGKELQRLGVTTVYTIGTPNLTPALHKYGVTHVRAFSHADPSELAAQVAMFIAQEAADAHIFSSLENTQVVIASVADDAWPDALAGSVLAASTIAPVLFTHKDSVPPATMRVLQDLQPGFISIIGGNAKIGPKARAAIGSKAFVLQEFFGASRNQTALRVAQHMYEQDTSLGRQVFFATGSNFPDALSAGPALAASQGMLLLAQPSQNAEAAAWLKSIGARGVYAIGGTKALSSSMMTEITSSLI